MQAETGKIYTDRSTDGIYKQTEATRNDRGEILKTNKSNDGIN